MARDYSKKLFLEGAWDKAKLPFEWLLNKFNPPEWENFKSSEGVVHGRS